MGALLDDAALVDDVDAVGVDDGGEAVGDDEHGAVGAELVECILDEAFGLAVEGRGGFVEDEDGGVFVHGAGDGEALALAAGEFGAALADDGVVALGLAGDEVMGVCDFGGCLYALYVGGGISVGDVLGDGIVEEDAFLGDDADHAAPVIDFEGADVLTVNQYAAGGGIVETGEEVGDGGLAAAAGTDEGDGLAAWELEVDAFEDFLLFVGKTDVFVADALLEVLDGDGVGLLFDFLFDFQKLLYTLEGGDAALDAGHGTGKGLDGLDEGAKEGDEADECTGFEFAAAGEDEVAAEKDDGDDDHHGQEFGEGGGEVAAAFEGDHEVAVLGVHLLVTATLIVFCAKGFHNPYPCDKFIEDGDEVAQSFLSAASPALEGLGDAADKEACGGEYDESKQGEFPGDEAEGDEDEEHLDGVRHHVLDGADDAFLHDLDVVDHDVDDAAFAFAGVEGHAEHAEAVEEAGAHGLDDALLEGGDEVGTEITEGPFEEDGDAEDCAEAHEHPPFVVVGDEVVHEEVGGLHEAGVAAGLGCGDHGAGTFLLEKDLKEGDDQCDGHRTKQVVKEEEGES